MDLKERTEMLSRLAKGIGEREGSFCEALALEIGQAVKVTKEEIRLSVKHLSTMEEDAPLVDGREPYGLMGAIFPYDGPTVMFARWVGAALLGGNRIRVSFSSLTPRVAELMREVCAPWQDLIEVVLGKDNRVFGQECIDDPQVRVFFVSGSGIVGRGYVRAVDFFDKIIYAGPGGMPPVLVFPGADVRQAATFAARRAFLNGGQYCTTIKRALVYKDLLEPFVESVLAVVDRMKVGDPLDPQVDFGPIKAERTRVLFQRGLETVKGSLLRGGSPEDEWLFPTVVLTRYIPDIEVSGPFLAIKAETSPSVILREAMKTMYPLIAYAFGEYTGGKKALERFYGSVYWDPKFLYLNPRDPFGGRRDSGWVLERRDSKIMRRGGPLVYPLELTQGFLGE
jgi:acyl-CoA reductase-like NAD-dependent aldehyde dehydrogenase